MKETVMKILKTFGLDKELDLYVKMFHKSPPHKFAVIKISGNTIKQKLSVIAEDLAFLSKLGLYPIIIHGGGKQIDEELTKKGIPIKKVEGLRVTDKKTIVILERVLNNISSKLVKSINKHGGHAINANGLDLIGVTKKQPVNQIDLGFVGDIKKIKIAKLAELCKSGYIPVLACIGHKNDISYNINADMLASELVRKIKPKKFILLTETGGIIDTEGKIISTIDVRTDLADLINQHVITEGMLLKVQEIEKLLEKVPSTAVEICSAENLLQELFTVKGSGTFIRYGGNFVVRNSFRDLNKNKIKSLLENSFSKKLLPYYFDEYIDKIIVERDYSGIAIVKKVKNVAYLDKFAIEKIAQGNGLGRTMWYFIKKSYHSLVWRSSITNPINSWYFKNCDGSQKADKWIIFWYNLNWKKVNELIPLILKIPKTLVKE